MLAVLQQFWDRLTTEARAFLKDAKTASGLQQLQLLAEYHLQILIDNADFINLSFALRRNNSEVSVSRNHLRQYVAAFDEIFRRGQDRGEFRNDASLWQARDIFYGSLEYSARSIEVFSETGPSSRRRQPVVDNMIALFASHYSAGDRDLMEGGQLDRIEAKLDLLVQ